MKIALSSLILACLCTAGAGAATEPLSGLPLPPGFTRTGDKTESWTFCGKHVASDVYYGDDTGPSDVAAWYLKALPGARVFRAGGLTTFFAPDGTAGVEAAGAAIAFSRYRPGLSAAEMKKIGASPATRSCA